MNIIRQSLTFGFLAAVLLLGLSQSAQAKEVIINTSNHVILKYDIFRAPDHKFAVRLIIENNANKPITTTSGFRVVFADGTYAEVDVGNLQPHKRFSLVAPQRFEKMPTYKSWKCEYKFL